MTAVLPFRRPEKTLRIICAWCRDVLQRGTPGAPTSHGICPVCLSQIG